MLLTPNVFWVNKLVNRKLVGRTYRFRIIEFVYELELYYMLGSRLIILDFTAPFHQHVDTYKTGTRRGEWVSLPRDLMVKGALLVYKGPS